MRSTSDTATSCHITPHATNLISRANEGLEHIANLCCIFVGISHLVMQFILPVLCCLLSILPIKVFYGLGRSNSKLLSSWLTFLINNLCGYWFTDIVGCPYCLTYRSMRKSIQPIFIWVNRIKHLLAIPIYRRSIRILPDFQSPRCCTIHWHEKILIEVFISIRNIIVTILQGLIQSSSTLCSCIARLS